MRCRVGDLAVCVGTGWGKNDGLLVTVLRPKPHVEPAWFVRSESSIYSFTSSRVLPPGSEVCIEDRLLRPIRDPGDDAKSEDLRELPATDLKEQACRTLDALSEMNDAFEKLERVISR